MHYLPSYTIHAIVMNINTTLIGFSLSGLLISRANIRTKSSGIIQRLSWEIRFIQINLIITLVQFLRFGNS
jgi:hypothetical protein